MNQELIIQPTQEHLPESSHTEDLSLEHKRISELPLEQRNYAQLLLSELEDILKPYNGNEQLLAQEAETDNEKEKLYTLYVSKKQELVKFLEDPEMNERRKLFIETNKEKFKECIKKELIQWAMQQPFVVAPNLHKWIDNNFIFEDDGSLVATRNLFLANNAGLISLPDRLIGVNDDLNLERCAQLVSMPRGFRYVDRSLNLSGCIKLASLPNGLIVGINLDLSECKNLISLPTGLYIGGKLKLYECKQLESLPLDLLADRIILSFGMQQKVYDNAERLKQEGQIKSIEYLT